MARIGGRNTVVTWMVGVLCVGVIVALLYLASPMGPVLLGYVTDVLGAAQP